MKIIYLSLSALFVLIMAICCVLLKRNKNKLSESLFRVNCGAISSTLIYIASTFNFPMEVSLFFSGLYYTSIHWLLLLFLIFTVIHTETNVHSPTLKRMCKVWYVIIIADSLSLSLNVFFRHAFIIEPVFTENVFSYWHTTYGLAFYLHLLFCYILVAAILFLLVRKTLTTNRFYRNKFLIIVIILLIVVLFNAIFLVTHFQLDISILTYCAFSIASVYYALYSVPHKIENTMLQLVSDNINSGVFCFDINKNLIYANKTAKLYFPLPEDRIIELDNLISENKELLFRNITMLHNNQKSTLYEEFQVLKDSSDKTIGYCLKFTDITKELQEVQDEQFRSTHDILTGLYNRESFFQQAEKILREDPDTPRYFIVTNIKNFKLVNDLFGSNFGDELLKTQAKWLQAANFEGTIHGRISGDKFAMLIKKSDFNPEKAAQNTRHIQAFTDDYNFKIHVVIGVYEISDPSEKVNSMFDKANLAIKSTQSDYSITIAYYTPELLNNVLESKTIVAAFEPALTAGNFKMYLQPQIDSKTEAVLGAEALVRWEHPVRGTLYPSSFISILEDTGYLYKLDLYIWTEAAKTLARWKQSGCDKYIAVNISARDFYYIDLYRFFTSLVKKYDIAPSKLKLEITETVLMYEPLYHKQILTKLQQEGFSIEMDDFGSGYSSLSMLTQIDVDILKIDMAFLRYTKNAERSKKILTSIIKMAKTLKMRIVMEGIEEISQAEFLKNLDVDVFQGFLYSRPIPLEDFEKRYIQGASK